MSQVPDPSTAPETPPAAKKRRTAMTRGRWIALVAAVAVLIGGTTAWALLRPKDDPQAGTRSFTATAELSDQTVSVGLTGTLSPRTQSNLNFGVSGTVTKVYVSAGDTVKKGAKLARIDDDDLKDALALAQANLETAQANLDDVEDGGSDAAVTAAKAQVKSAKAAVTSAEDDLDSAVLRSTIAGTVASVDLSVGDTVSANSSSGSSGGASGSGGNAGGSGIPGSTTGSTTSTEAQVVVISTDTWKLDGTVGSADLGNLKAGQAATVTPDGASEPIPGKVSSIGIVATSSEDGSATFPVEVSLDGKHPELFSGTTASASITVAEYLDVLTVPTMAITTRDGKSVVTKVDGDTTSEVEVTVGRVFGEATEITAGLAEGDTVQITVRTPQRDADSGGGGLFGGGGGFSGPPGGGAEPPSGGGAPPTGGVPGGDGGGNR